MAWLSGCDFWEEDGRERSLLRVCCVIIVLMCVEERASHDMSDHVTFVNYVIVSGRTLRVRYAALQSPDEN